MIEIWKEIKGFEGLYEVSNLGKVRSLDRLICMNNGVKRNFYGKVLKQGRLYTGYKTVWLYNNSIGIKTKASVHRLVAEAFIPNPENKPQVNHIDENKTNNRVDNLEWCTAKENINYGTRNERATSKSNKKKRKQIIATNITTSESNIYQSLSECAKTLNLDIGNISKVASGKYNRCGGYTFEYVSK